VADGLSVILAEARDLGLLGPGDPEAHRSHAEAFADAWAGLAPGPPERFCDLGAGGGVPGLVLACRWDGTQVALLEASGRRCDFLRRAVALLGLTGRANVLEGRAELLSRTPALEGAFPLVTARSFAAPAATAECATRLLAGSGRLMVSEPPESSSALRWPPEGLAHLSLELERTIPGPPALAVLRRSGPVEDRYPRRDGVPARRPLF
jgi:16S rRNA (guanine527-N7)-methyltransferase